MSLKSFIIETNRTNENYQALANKWFKVLSSFWFKNSTLFLNEKIADLLMLENLFLML